MSQEKVLFVDDEAEVLKSIERSLYGRFGMDFALGGEEGIRKVKEEGPFAVVVSDYRMPRMNGIDFLSRIKELSPDTIRMMLTGYAELETAIQAVNEGHVFRFLTKPCPPGQLATAVESGIEYYTLKQAEKELLVLKKWRKSIEEIILAFSMLIETRDPYTAGHQRRVAELACAMAGELGYSKDKTEAIRLSAMIHDIGKMYVPAEILNRPGKLSDLEFELLKIHPKVGYDILKPIDLEFPISDIILQHHERLDGSGYPSGLRSGEILPEAQLLAVADVVEAMNSHRPYRPSLGLDKALSMIREGRDVVFDSAAVDACLSLFLEKGFAFQDSF
jgi:putative two-component system response regulator